MLIAWLLEKLYPPKCVLCRRVLREGEQDICGACRVEVPEYSQRNLKLQFLDSWTAVWYYEDKVRGSILRYKFHNQRSYALSYGKFLAAKLRREYPQGFDVITWVPVSRLRRLSRGYDQVQLLADALCGELGTAPVAALRKLRNNRKQSGIVGHAQRRANVLGAYACIAPEAVRGRRVLLLDDILTTGATAGECARILLTAGAAEVHCAVIAAAVKTKKPK